jgi:hypothetical protein
MKYPLLSWLMTPHKEDGETHLILELFYKCKHMRGRLVVENAFGILKQIFIKLQERTKLHTTIILDVFSTCCLLHNLSLGRKRWMWKRSCEWFNWKYARYSCTKFQWITSWRRKCSHLGSRVLWGTKPSQLGDLFYYTTSLAMYEVSILAYYWHSFNSKKLVPCKCKFLSSTRLSKNLFMFFLWCNIFVWC